MATSYGERLKEALRYRGIPQREFTRRIKPLVARGGSYRSLSNYLANDFTPTQTWTRAAAEILGVSELWLANNEGQMLPGETEKKPDDPNFQSCAWALDSLKPYLSTTTHISTFTQLMLARDRFEDVYGSTRGMSGADAKQAYAPHLLRPLKVLLLHVTGSDRIEDVGPEVIRQALGHYLELTLLLMPSQDFVTDDARKAVSACLSQWRKELEGSLESRVGKQLQVNPLTKEEV